MDSPNAAIPKPTGGLGNFQGAETRRSPFEGTEAPNAPGPRMGRGSGGCAEFAIILWQLGRLWRHTVGRLQGSEHGPCAAPSDLANEPSRRGLVAMRKALRCLHGL